MAGAVKVACPPGGTVTSTAVPWMCTVCDTESWFDTVTRAPGLTVSAEKANPEIVIVGALAAAGEPPVLVTGDADGGATVGIAVTRTEAEPFQLVRHPREGERDTDPGQVDLAVDRDALVDVQPVPVGPDGLAVADRHHFRRVV